MAPVTATRRPINAANKAPAKKPAPRKKAAPSPEPGLGHRTELIGLGLLVVGVLSGLGIYADLTGPVGRAVRDGAGAMFGWGRLVVPVALAATVSIAA